MNLKIGPYKIIQRTEYSKLQVIDKDNKRIDKALEEKILLDYKNQKDAPEKYFAIKDNVLSDYDNTMELSYVFIPENINYILPYVFSPSTVKLINIPDTVKYVGTQAFKGSLVLEEITLPDEINDVGDAIFCDCSSLKSVELSENLEVISPYMFSNCKSLTSLKIPDTVKTIGSYAFEGCSCLEKINIPRDFEEFGLSPFTNSGIKTLQINHDIKKKHNPFVSYGGYLLDTNICELEISGNVKYIDPNFVKGISGIVRIEYAGSKNEFKNFKAKNEEFFKTLGSYVVNFKEYLEELIDDKHENNDIKEDKILEER